MPTRHITLRTPVPPGEVVDPAGLSARFAAIRAENDVPAAFPDPALAEAEAVSRLTRGLPERDETGLPFITIDPAGSRDLDQAMYLEADGGGHRVRYAIADVPVFVRPGGALDVEARRRGQTYYLPDGSTPLHPPVLSEGAASLLPHRVRPAFVWDLRLDADGRVTSTSLHRAMVRSVSRLDYRTVQADLDTGRADEQVRLLREVGERRIRREHERGGADLPLPEQEVTVDADGHYVLSFRPPVDSEDWNAQVSLMTGMAAAEMMLEAGIGILRTLPAPDTSVLRRFHHQARALGVEWPQDTRYGDFLRSLDRTDPRHLALIHEATALFRGAGYTPFDGRRPLETGHAAVASTYAHVTAPLRRLVDRFGLVVCEALSRGREVPDWARAALPDLPATMAETDRRAHAVERACADAVEAAALRHRVGDHFRGVVVDVRGDDRAVVQVDDPAVVAEADGVAAAGEVVDVVLAEADVATGRVRFRMTSG